MATEALRVEPSLARDRAAGVAAGTLGFALGALKDAFGQEVPAGDLNRRAALHILNRLGFGPRPGDVDRVISIGLDRYILQQFETRPDAALDQRLDAFPYVKWTVPETWGYYLIDQRDQGTRYIAQLHEQQRTVQIVRAVHSENQLLEVMTWFWYNHFNVNVTDDYVQYSGHDYENELRKVALGKFKDLLSASAHHVAMMSYLDNYQSTVSKYDRSGRLLSGVNENYGRELMELHTVGVDAGYTQAHVYNAATVLTGWGLNRNTGLFTFTPSNHDTQATEVFGLTIPAGQMQESGEALLDYLAHHEKTSQFIATKLVRHFVADTPPAELVSRVAQTFRDSEGDVKSMLKTIIDSKEFWAEAFGPGKYRNPFQYVASTLRAVGADVQDGRAVSNVLTAMGQPQYSCIPPTGWTDKGFEWADPTSQLNRMNFALDLVSNVTGGNATQPFTGVFVDLAKVFADNKINATDPNAVASFFNREILGNKLGGSSLGQVTSVSATGAVPVGNRVAGLILASPEAQGR
jgi:uncharacterized protein (DUF1800 family)